MNIFLQAILLLGLMIVLIFLSGFFSGSETALTNLNASDVAHMRRKKVRNAEYVYKLKKNMDRTLITILIGNNIVNIVLSSVAAIFANALFAAAGVTIMVFIITFLIIVFGEITPKSNAVNNSKKVATWVSPVIYFLSIALYPLILLFLFISQGIIRIFGGKRKDKQLFVTDDSIKELVRLGEEEGVIKGIEKDIIESVFVFGDAKVHQIMVPISDVFSVTSDMQIKEAKKKIAKRGFTRIPIIDEEEKIIGMVYTKDLLGVREGDVASIMRKPEVISGSRDVTEVFNQMKKKRIHFAVVMDKKGHQIGIVTLEDILEELVGEIYDEFSDRKYGSKPLPA